MMMNYQVIVLIRILEATIFHILNRHGTPVEMQAVKIIIHQVAKHRTIPEEIFRIFHPDLD